MRLIPSDTKVKIEIFKGISIWDLLVGLVTGLLLVFVLVSDFPFRILFAAIIVVLGGFLLARIVEGEATYTHIMKVLRYLVLPKRFERIYTDDMLYEKSIGVLKDEFLGSYGLIGEQEGSDEDELKKGVKLMDRIRGLKLFSPGFMDDIIAFTHVSDGLIDYAGEYCGGVIEISPIEYRFMSDRDRNACIEEGVGSVLRSVTDGYAANIIKLDRPVRFDDHLESEYDKLDALRMSYEKAMIDEDEFMARTEIEYDRIDYLRDICYNEKIIMPSYYIALFDNDADRLSQKLADAVDKLAEHGLTAGRLDTTELLIFLKYTSALDFEERDVEEMDPEDLDMWAMPESVTVTPHYVMVSGKKTVNFRISGFASAVDNAWMSEVMELSGTRVVMKCRPVEREKAVHDVDRSLGELRAKLNSTGMSDSRQIETEASVESLSSLLTLLQEENETLLEVNIYVTVYDDPDYENFFETIVGAYRERGMELDRMDYRQIDAFVGGQVSACDPLDKKSRAIPSNTIAAAFPWIHARVSDVGGIHLGDREKVPVFVDFFRRDAERVNSNMVIVGKSGSGKSYATKTLLANLASEDSKIFILDPENEYGTLAKNLHGRVINAGTGADGRINPFHIMTVLEDDDEGAGTGNSYAAHMQFLEEFYRQILPDCEPDALEYLSTLTERAYAQKNIYSSTDFSRLSPEDYPTFDDVYDQVLFEFETTSNEYLKSSLRTLINYVSKFAEGGRNAEIWNGPSTITTDFNFTVFNFQSMLAGRNSTISNAQMLLILKYLDNEIIKNRDYNTRYNLHRKVIVVIDEAHVFIDSKYPVALDFMYQMAKRIRKYNGMQIVITQNIKDFVGNPEVAAKSAAIINACQYSMIFPLAPNDIADLCTLYEKAGGINEKEQEEILNAPRGRAFMILSSTSRSEVDIDAGEDVAEMFEKDDFVSGYFVGRVGAELWKRYLGDSKKQHFATKSEEELLDIMESEENKKEADTISFSNISFSIESEDGAAIEDDIIIDGKKLSFSKEDDSSSEITFTIGDGDDKEDKNDQKPPLSEAVTDGERIMAMLMGQENYNAMIASIRERIIREVKEDMNK